jgi:hypothetical protein
LVQRPHERRVASRVQNKEALVQQNIDRVAARTLDHELGARLAEDGRGIIDQLPRPRFNTEIDAASCLCGAILDRNICGRCRWRTGSRHFPIIGRRIDNVNTDRVEAVACP